MKKLFISAIISLILLTSCSGDQLSKNAVKSEGFSCPSTHPIKGNKNDKGEWIYHNPGQQYYNKTDAEECFSKEDDAIAAGYRKSKR